MNTLDDMLRESLRSDGETFEPHRPDALATIKSRAKVRRAFVVGLSLILVIAVASGTTLAWRAFSPSAEGSLISPSHRTTDPHYKQATDEAVRLLRAARIPPGAISVSSAPVATLRQPAGYPASDQLIDRARWWTLAGSFDATVTWIRDHPPAHLKAGMTGSGSGPNGERSMEFGYSDDATDAYIEPQLQVEIVPFDSGHSAIRADGMDIWVTSAPSVDDRGGPFLRVTMAAGCPATLTGYNDVRNPQKNLHQRMLPSADPTSAMICRYRGPGPGEKSTKLAHRTDLSTVVARTLARTINKINLGSAGGIRSMCPEGGNSHDIIVFGYPHDSDADLWFEPSGCSFLDNGFVFAGAIANNSYGDFYKQMTSLDPVAERNSS